MLQALLFAPYIALGSSALLAATVVAICCTQKTAAFSEQNSVRSQRRRDVRLGMTQIVFAPGNGKGRAAQRRAGRVAVA